MLQAQHLITRGASDHRVDLDGDHRLLGVSGQCMREHEEHRLILLDDRQRFFLAAFDEGRPACLATANDPSKGVSGYQVAARRCTRRFRRNTILAAAPPIAHIGKYDEIFARLCVVWHCVDT
jgi:hypothetical protein